MVQLSLKHFKIVFQFPHYHFEYTAVSVVKCFFFTKKDSIVDSRKILYTIYFDLRLLWSLATLSSSVLIFIQIVKNRLKINVPFKSYRKNNCYHICGITEEYHPLSDLNR
jgi:hypothetical protein